jgi:pimeloyl-ACP methyl ester carboxylesterase
MSVIIRNQAIIHYEALGRGRPVVFLHSWIGSWRYWIPSMQVASVSHRGYALDLFGYGDTTHDPSLYALGPQADLLTGFLDEMGIGKVAVVGHGLGAWVGCLAAARQPGRVARIMAVSMPLEASSVHVRLRSDNPAELVDWLAGRRPESLDVLTDASRMDPGVVAGCIISFQAEDPFSQFLGTRVPCLLVYGLDDPSLQVPSTDGSAPLGPNVHQVNLADSGHFPMMDAADRFNRLLTDFLAVEPGLSLRDLQLKELWRRRIR